MMDNQVIWRDIILPIPTDPAEKVDVRNFPLRFCSILDFRPNAYFTILLQLGVHVSLWLCMCTLFVFAYVSS